jgi:hypothetical protein
MSQRRMSSPRIGSTSPSSCPRLTVGDAVMANEKAPKDFHNRRGVIAALGPGGAVARVLFDDGLRPTTGYLRSRWLEL